MLWSVPWRDVSQWDWELNGTFARIMLTGIAANQHAIPTGAEVARTFAAPMESKSRSTFRNHCGILSVLPALRSDVAMPSRTRGTDLRGVIGTEDGLR
ncbi:hypothetical protein PM082_011100 [Marasmius tenuissimus]|nr:hypothetical protein PM082_011100 [Marasmius tenuissimus]